MTDHRGEQQGEGARDDTDVAGARRRALTSVADVRLFRAATLEQLNTI